MKASRIPRYFFVVVLSILTLILSVGVTSALAAPAKVGTITEYPVPTASSNPYAITTGPDGNLWFTESTANKIAVSTPKGQVLHEYPITTANSGAKNITTGPDGNLWFTESTA